VFRTRVLALWRRPRSLLLYLGAVYVCFAIGTNVTYPLASSIGGDAGLAIHYFGLFAFVTAISLVSLKFEQASLQADSARGIDASGIRKVQTLSILCLAQGLALVAVGLLSPVLRWANWAVAGIFLVGSSLGVREALRAHRSDHKNEHARGGR
jgi:hypothetical protein